MAKANKVIDLILDFFETKVCCLLFALTCAVLFIQVVFRAFGLGVSWCEEIARYLNVWVIYLAAAKAVKLSKHMSVDLLPLVLKGKAKIILHIFTNVVSLIFFLVLARFGAQVLGNMTVRPQYSAANSINMMIPYAAPTVGAILMIIRQIQILIDYFLELSGKKGLISGKPDETGNTEVTG